MEMVQLLNHLAIVIQAASSCISVGRLTHPPFYRLKMGDVDLLFVS
jgi:hypothetical protein